MVSWFLIHDNWCVYRRIPDVDWMVHKSLMFDWWFQVVNGGDDYYVVKRLDTSIMMVYMLVENNHSKKWLINWKLLYNIYIPFIDHQSSLTMMEALAPNLRRRRFFTARKTWKHISALICSHSFWRSLDWTAFHLSKHGHWVRTPGSIEAAKQVALEIYTIWYLRPDMIVFWLVLQVL